MMAARRSRSCRAFSPITCASARTSAPEARRAAAARTSLNCVTTSAESRSRASSRRLTSTRTKPLRPSIVVDQLPSQPDLGLCRRPRNVESNGGQGLGRGGSRLRQDDVRGRRKQDQGERQPCRRVGRGGDRLGNHLDDLRERRHSLAHRRDVHPGGGPLRRRQELHDQRALAALEPLNQLLALGVAQLRPELGGQRGRGGRATPASWCLTEVGQGVQQRLRRGGHRFFLGEGAHPLLDGPNSGEQRLHRPGRQPSGGPVGVAQDRLHRVGDVDDRLDAHHRRQSLEGMKRAEEIANLPRRRLPLRGRRLHGEQIGVGRRQVLFGLGDEPGDEVGRVEAAAHAGTPGRAPIKARTSPRSSMERTAWS